MRHEGGGGGAACILTRGVLFVKPRPAVMNAAAKNSDTQNPFQLALSVRLPKCTAWLRMRLAGHAELLCHASRRRLLRSWACCRVEPSTPLAVQHDTSCYFTR